MDSLLKWNSFTTQLMMHSPQRFNDVETEVLKLKHDISSLKFALRGEMSRSAKSREIHQLILEKWDRINQLEN